MKRLYYVRHGESEANVAKIFAGRMDTPLTELGKQQAKTAGVQAKALQIDLIITSPLSRAYETAQIIASEIGYPVDKIISNDLFMERDYGPFQGKPWGPELDLNPTGVETIESVLERGRLAYQYIQTLPQDTILVVSHGTFWRAFRAAVHPQFALADGDKAKNAQIIQLL